MTRPTASPSSLMPDCPSVPSRLMKSLPWLNACEPLAVGLRTLKSFPKMVSPISRCKSIPSLSLCAKAQEQSINTVLDRELPNGSPLIDEMLPSGIVLVLSSKHGGNHTFARCSVEKVEVSTRKGSSANRHSPLPNTALMLHKSMPVSSIQALIPSPSSWAIQMQRWCAVWRTWPKNT